MFRAIAIIAVVMIHTTPAGQWQVFCKRFINFAVATFIFLSGYLTKADNENWLKFYIRRITLKLSPILSSSIFMLITYYVLERCAPRVNRGSHVPKSKLLRKLNFQRSILGLQHL